MFLRGLRKAHFSCSNRLIKLTKIVLFTPAEKSKYNYIYKIILNFKLKKSSLFSQQIKKLISCFVSLAYFHAMCTKLCKIISSAQRFSKNQKSYFTVVENLAKPEKIYKLIKKHLIYPKCVFADRLSGEIWGEYFTLKVRGKMDYRGR